MKDYQLVANHKFENNRELLQNSMFFNEPWYLKRNRDVASAGIDAAEHYLKFGAAEGRDPSPFFSTTQYLEKFPHLLENKVNPLVHFLRLEILNLDADFSSFGINLLGAFDVCSDFARKKSGVKALFVTHDLNIGGAPRVLANIAAWFQKHTDYEVYVISMSGGPLVSIFDNVAPLHIVGNSLIVTQENIDSARVEIEKFVGGEPAFIFVNSAAAGGFFDVNPYGSPKFGYIHEMPKVLSLFADHYKKLKEAVDHLFVGYTKELAKTLDLHDCTHRPAFIDVDTTNVFLDKNDKSKIRESFGWNANTSIVMGCGVLDWRKQPDLFVRAAKHLIVGLDRDVRFIWCGGGGEELDRVQRMAVQFGVADRVEFLGYREDFSKLIEAADVFALCSIEDPFPLVCLQAGAASVPSVVFREATGMVALVEPDGKEPAGIAVALGDEPSFFDALDSLITNDDLRENLSKEARNRVLAHYTTPSACREILQIVREKANIAPKVSIVVPSYNCAPYLEQRLESIARQTFQDIEIIINDDNSTDDSPRILDSFAASRPYVRLSYEKSNSGSVFKAWSRGVKKATGDLIWIAEADDYCEDDFLEKIVSEMTVSGVRLAHGRSIPVDRSGDVLGDWNDLYLDKIAPGHWHRSFVSPAAKEVNLTLGRANTIPNVSAVVVRRSAALRALDVAQNFKLAGDWAFYVRACVGGRIAYCHDAVNYHRRHLESVTSKVEGTRLYFQELVNVGALIKWLYGTNKERENGFERHLASEIKRFEFKDNLPISNLPDSATENRQPGILFGVGDLSGGGAQMFAIRFVNEWDAYGDPAVLLVVGHDQDHVATKSKISPDIAIIDTSEIEAAGGLTQFMADWGLSVIFTGHWWADRTIAAWKDRDGASIPWAVVMHGCYEIVTSSREHFPGFENDFALIEKHCDCWVWTAPKNKHVFDEGYITPKNMEHIVNGFRPIKNSNCDRTRLGISTEAFVFTLASRAIEEKGWLVAVEAFKSLRAKFSASHDLILQLIGDGPIMEHLRPSDKIEGVHFVKHTSQLADYIAASDVCLLPSWFLGESLPLTVIEFLAQGKPAIVSDIGMCPWAISAEGAEAGYVVERDSSGRIHPDDLAKAMSHFVEDKSLAKKLAPVAHSAFEKFNMDVMLTKYRNLAVHLVSERQSETRQNIPDRPTP